MVGVCVAVWLGSLKFKIAAQSLVKNGESKYFRAANFANGKFANHKELSLYLGNVSVGPPEWKAGESRWKRGHNEFPITFYGHIFKARYSQLLEIKNILERLGKQSQWCRSGIWKYYDTVFKNFPGKYQGFSTYFLERRRRKLEEWINSLHGEIRQKFFELLFKPLLQKELNVQKKVASVLPLPMQQLSKTCQALRVVQESHYPQPAHQAVEDIIKKNPKVLSRAFICKYFSDSEVAEKFMESDASRINAGVRGALARKRTSQRMNNAASRIQAGLRAVSVRKPIAAN